MRISDWSSDVCSSDLTRAVPASPRGLPCACCAAPLHHHRRRYTRPIRPDSGLLRSEEHTSELQSLMRISYAVFCLKKKKHKNSIITKISDSLITSIHYHKQH